MKNSNKNKILLYIFISILLILLYCVFTPYKNKYTIIQNENLTNPSNNNTYCSSLQGQPGVTYKECLPGDTSCIQGQQCSICTSSRTNISCTGIPCTTDVDCADHGGKCSNGKCVQPSPPSSSCKTDSDCGSGMICQNGNCVQSSPYPPGGNCTGTPVRNTTPFPSSNDVFFAVQYRNSTNIPITVWLQGNQPPCSDTGPSCNFQETDTWSDIIKAKFSIIDKNNNKINKQPTRNQILQPGEVWRIELPLDSKGKPAWCYGNGNKNCPGVRAWFTRSNVTGLQANNGYTGIEPNFNAGNSIDYDISGVDGLNANVTVEYTGDCGGIQTYKKCLTKLDECYSLTTKNGVKTCLSPSNISNPNPMAGCSTGSMDDPIQCQKKMNCHKWWAENEDGQKWLNFVQKNECGECDAYGWAYDEMTYKDGDCPYTNNCDPGQPIGPCDYNKGRPISNTRNNNVVNPNIDCSQFPYKKNTYFNVDILKIL